MIVDDTADIARAARCIVDGASFDNNVLCTAEKEVLVFENVADRLVAEMQGCGALLVEGAALERLLAKVVVPGEPYPHPNGKYPHPNKAFVGKDASVLLEAAGLSSSREVRLLIAEVPFEHPLVQGEMLMPLLPIVRVKDLDDALAKALVAEHGYRHSAMMHSESVSRLTRVAREIETTIFTKNAPSYAGLGYGGEGYCTLSIAGPTGEGLTSARKTSRASAAALVGGLHPVGASVGRAVRRADPLPHPRRRRRRRGRRQFPRTPSTARVEVVLANGGEALAVDRQKSARPRRIRIRPTDATGRCRDRTRRSTTTRSTP